MRGIEIDRIASAQRVVDDFVALIKNSRENLGAHTLNAHCTIKLQPYFFPPFFPRLPFVYRLHSNFELNASCAECQWSLADMLLALNLAVWRVRILSTKQPSCIITVEMPLVISPHQSFTCCQYTGPLTFAHKRPALALTHTHTFGCGSDPFSSRSLQSSAADTNQNEKQAANTLHRLSTMRRNRNNFVGLKSTAAIGAQEQE